ncbi:MAG: hypothetical protein JXQ73_31285 [Phycisphaerae bacterium]|nr:hypothetical protein [Phycisphaerae bacterium]
MHTTNRTAYWLITAALATACLPKLALPQTPPKGDTAPALAPAAQSPSPPSKPMPGWFSVTDFGAVADDKTDCTKAFDDALKAADAADGGIVWVPAGKYRVRELTIPRRVTLRGTFEAPPRHWKSGGTVIMAVPEKTGEDGRPFCIMHECAALRGLTIHYPNQKATDTPDPYPWCVRGIGDNVTLTDVLLSNPYNGIDLGTEHPAGRHYVNRVNMHALRRGIYVDKCFDVGRIESLHIWPFWQMDGPIRKFTIEHGEAFIIGKTDWEYVTNCFCIGYKIGFHFIKTAHGAGNGVFTNSGSDVGPLAVLVDEVQRHSGISFVNCQMMATVKVAATNRGPVKFTGCGFWPIKETGPQAILDGQDTVSFNACHFAGWDENKSGQACIVAAAGSLIVTGCDFLKEKAVKHVVLGEKLQSAVITASRFRGGEKIENHSHGDVQIGLNVGR